jgi:chemotaxis protein CheD
MESDPLTEKITVGMAEVKICRSENSILIALGLGSCVGVCIYDPVLSLAGMAHVVLPSRTNLEEDDPRYADIAVPQLVERLQKEGALRTRMRVALAGGGQIFKGFGTISKLDIGPRNVEAVQHQIARFGMPIVAADLGGNVGRTLLFYGDGRVYVRLPGQEERLLAALGASEKASPWKSINPSSLAKAA